MQEAIFTDHITGNLTGILQDSSRIGIFAQNRS